ncbi:MAG: trypsin-like peptidase domain-containing protein, partial [Bryobacterales bacterium]|nr:trypsin-like peptidase domain-containing protein [Bryobacterales bacterium]
MTFAFLLLIAAIANSSAAESSVLLRNSAGQSTAYSGIAAIVYGRTCTAWLLDTQPAVPASAPAYAIFNGHCVSFLQENEVIVDRPALGIELTFNYFVDTQDRTRIVKATRIAYATMKGSDIGIVELDAKFGELVSAGFRPLRIGDALPEGRTIEVVGRPGAGILVGQDYMRKARCTQGPAVNVLEHEWHWWALRRNDCIDIKPGSSGSPVIDPATGRVTAIINTTTEDAFDRGEDIDCTLGVPCEIEGARTRMVDWAAYAVPVQGVDRCFDTAGRFSLSLQGCPLDNGRQLGISRPYPPSIQPVQNGKLASWAVRPVAAALSHYRYKAIAGGPEGCRELNGYGPIRPLSLHPLIDEVIGSRDGYYTLCVIAGSTAAFDATWQQPAFASTVVVRLDSVPPPSRTLLQLEDRGTFYTIAFERETTAANMGEYKSGPPTEIDCASSEDWYTAIFIPLQIEKRRLPWRVCARSSDAAGNRTAPVEFTMDGPRIVPHGIVNAASYRLDPLAPGSLAAIFGIRFTSTPAVRASGAEVLGGVSVFVTGGDGVRRAAPLFLATAGQVNIRIPSETPPGQAMIELTGPNGVARAPVALTPAAPGLFLVGTSQASLAAFSLRRTGSDLSRAPLYECQDYFACQTLPLKVPQAGEEALLSFLGTGVGSANPNGVRVWVGPVPMPVESVTPVPEQPGVHEIAVRFPPGFAITGYVPVQV